MTDWLVRAGVSAASVELLRELASSKKPVGSIFQHDLDEIRTESEGEKWRSAVAHGLVLFGSASNGDAWAIDVQNGECVVALSHDEVWEAEEGFSPREAAVVVAESLAGALDMARANVLPFDYWDATDIELKDGRRVATGTWDEDL